MTLREIFNSVFPKTRLNRSLQILIAVNTMSIFVLGLFGPFYALFIQKIGGDVALAGLSWAIFLILAGVLTLLFASWGLRVKEHELLLSFGYIIRGLVFISYAFMGSIFQLILTQILWGISVALGAPAFDTIYAEHTSKEGAFFEWGRWEGISNIAAGVAALIGGILIQSVGYQVVFLLMALISFVLGIYIWRLPREVL